MNTLSIVVFVNSATIVCYKLFLPCLDSVAGIQLYIKECLNTVLKLGHFRVSN